MKKTLFHLLLFSVFVCITFACQSKDENRIIEKAATLIQTNPDSSLVLLSTLDVDRLKTKRHQARYSLYFSAALDKNYIDIASDSIIKPALDYYQKHGTKREKMLMWYYYGRVLFNNKSYPSSVVAFEKAAALANELGDTRYQGLIYRNIASSFNHSNNISASIDYIKQAISCFSSSPADSSYYVYANYSLASALVSNKNYEPADSILNTIIGRGYPDLDNLAFALKAHISLFSKKNPQQAAYYFSLIPEYRLTVRDLSANALALDKCGNTDSADYYLNKAFRICQDREDTAIANYFKSVALFRRGDSDNAYKCLDNSFHVQDSLTRAQLNESVSSAQREFFQSESENQKNLVKKTRTISALSVMVLFLTALLIVSILTSIVRKKDHNLRLLLAQQTISNEQIITLNKRNATLLSSRLSEKIRQLVIMSKGYFNADTEIQRENVFRQFKVFIDEFYNNDSFYKSLKDDLNYYCDGIIDKLTEQLPQIRGRHLNLISLFFAGLPYETIAIITKATSIHSLKTQRSRYRKIIQESQPKDSSLFLKMLEVEHVDKNER